MKSKTLSAIVVGSILAVAGSLRLAGNPPARAAQQDVGTNIESADEADRKSAGCITCHLNVDAPSMHTGNTVRLGCTDCHGGDASVKLPAGATPHSAAYDDARNRAHPQPRLHRDSRDFQDLYTQWLKESPEYIRFLNPGDLRIADETCGQSSCHALELREVRSSMMTHGGMLWGAALYNNGAFPLKDAHFGEAYDRDGAPVRLRTWPAPSAGETQSKGVLPFLDPLERWEVSLPGNILRVFERGGGERTALGIPGQAIDPEPGRPDVKLSDRGLGTELRTDPVFLGLQKTRLADPLLSMPGTNDHPGDYRASGCSACHVVYANDRSPAHSAQFAHYGNQGFSAQSDRTTPRGEPGHAIRHEFTLAIPSSQCMVCHIHPGTNMLATFFGYTWWDNEVDGESMYPHAQRNPSEEARYQAGLHNPEAAAPRGLWSDAKFLEQTGSPEFNSKLQETQFADFHGHGWVFRAVYKRDRKGNLLDGQNRIVPFDDPGKFHKAVHLMDIHLEKGMQCVDCHFQQDAHGNGKIYGEPRAAIEITCTDCHGSIQQKAALITTGPAAPAGGTSLGARRTPWGERQFYWQGGKLLQRSMVTPGTQWEVVQVLDTITPGNPHYSEASRLAKTMLRDGKTWGAVPANAGLLAHSDTQITCDSCHSSWTPTCFGCHLSMAANQRRPMLHNEGLVTRNWTSYNFQVLRDDSYMLAIDGTVTGRRVAPARSSCAVVVSSQNADREWLYYTQQTVSAEGFSGQAFSTYVPHTTRATETKTCTDCHVSAERDNNAWMAQLLLLGTNFLNFEPRYSFVAAGKGGIDAVSTAEHDDPEAVMGSDFQRVAYPHDFSAHVARGRRLVTAYHHAAGEVLDVQLRGEYLYAALGKGGLRIYDVANIDNKGFSQKFTTSPVSPLGQRFYLKTKYAMAVASPTTLAVDPAREHRPENEEQKVHSMYGFLYVADREEGLIVVGDPNLAGKMPGVVTLLDGDPRNNFLKRAVTFNPGGILRGARRIAIAGVYAYVLCDRGLVVVSLDNPLQPRVTAELGRPALVDPRGIAIQFRYAFVTDAEGLKVLDVTSLDHPQPLAGARVPLPDARNVYVARTYAYVSAGKQGLAIVDVERPERPVLDQFFDAGGRMDDTNDVKMGATASSVFAYVADGRNGFRIVQLVAPEDDPRFAGFSPRPHPKLIATYKTHGPALAVSKGIDRDRAVDEDGNQLAVFGRRGARPFNAQEMRRLYLQNGKLFTVTNHPPGPPLN